MIILESNTEIRDHDNIMIDTEYGFDLAIRHFIALGYEEIGFISERVSAEVRLPNFTKVLTDNRVKVRKRFIKIGDERFELGGYLRMKELLAEKDFPRAVLASYDDMAIGALRAIYEAGYRVPDDISVIGYDNIRVSEYLVSPLSTIAPPVREMVNIGVKMLLDKIENPEDTRKHKISLKPDLVLRATTKQ